MINLINRVFTRLAYMLVPLLPDSAGLKFWYRKRMKRKLNLKDPQRFTEKIQWYKLYYRNPVMRGCTDKYEVRKYMEDRGYGHLLNTLYLCCDSPDDIDFDALPDKFVMKTNNASGTNIIVEDKSLLDINKSKAMLRRWLRKNRRFFPYNEWCYYDIKPRIVIEKYLGLGDLPDYKFYCFGGKVFSLLYKCETGSGKGKDALLDRDFNMLPYVKKGTPSVDGKPQKPVNYDEMVKIAEDLSKPFPHVRDDLYNVEGKIYFGELTFYSASGYAQYDPDEFDFLMGKQFILEKYEE